MAVMTWPKQIDWYVFSKNTVVAAFRGMHVSPAKHSYAWLPRKCDYRTDTLSIQKLWSVLEFTTNKQTERQDNNNIPRIFWLRGIKMECIKIEFNSVHII